jgi:CDP-diglyceride synthetase
LAEPLIYADLTDYTDMIKTLMIAANYLHSDITASIIGAAFKVHKFLDNGFQEKIYRGVGGGV